MIADRIVRTLDDLTITRIGGVPWFFAVEVAQLLHVPGTGKITRTVSKGRKRRISVRIGLYDNCPYSAIDGTGLTEASIQYGEIPTQQVKDYLDAISQRHHGAEE
jgi:hypothetical protein